MKQLVRQKLESQEGASILMALFLFLVCAVLAAVILAASTAASGRTAGLAEGDQKYYSVSSAAELMRDMMGGANGVSAKITCKKTTVFERSSSGVMTQKSVSYGSPEISSVGDTDAARFFAKLAEQLVLAEAGGSNEDAWNWQFGSSTGSSAAGNFKVNYAYNMGAVTGGSSADAVRILQQVDVDAAMRPNGDIVMTFSAGKSQNGSLQTAYIMQLTCEAKGETQSQTSTRTSGNNVTRTDTKTTTITWKAASLKSPTSLGTA